VVDVDVVAVLGVYLVVGVEFVVAVVVGVIVEGGVDAGVGFVLVGELACGGMGASGVDRCGPVATVYRGGGLVVFGVAVGVAAERDRRTVTEAGAV